MDPITKIYSVLSPQKALERMVAKTKLEILNSGYSESGASFLKKAFKGWRASSSSPEMDINMNLRTLRNRSRSLSMGAPVARSALNTIRTNVIGSGLRLKAHIDFDYLGLSSDEADAWERQAEREFNFWAESKSCDSLKINNFYELQQLAQFSWLASGDCFVALKYTKPSFFMPYGLRLHVLEADRVCNPYHCEVFLENTNSYTENHKKLISGIELDDEGAVAAYWIVNRFPEFNTALQEPLEWERVEAFGKLTGRPNILHLIETERPEQRRGVPILSTVIEPLKQLGRYTESELMAAVISSMFTVFVTTKTPDGGAGFELGSNVPSAQRSMSGTKSETDLQLAPGMINILEEGESIEIADPKRPINNFDAFVIAITRQVGAALEIPQELLLKSFTASYSASRAALLEAWKSFKMRRGWMETGLCQPIYEQFLTEAVALGRIKAPGFFEDPVIQKAWCSAEWVGPTQGQLNPVLEVQASELKVKNGFSTRERETAELTGGDFDKNVEQINREIQKMPREDGAKDE